MTALVALAWVAVVILGAVVGHLVEEWALRGEDDEWRDGGGR